MWIFLYQLPNLYWVNFICNTLLQILTITNTKSLERETILLGSLSKTKDSYIFLHVSILSLTSLHLISYFFCLLNMKLASMFTLPKELKI